jgi:hypothetical protein
VSGSAITQSQVVNLVSDLAGKANLAGGNAFTGAQTITGTASGSQVLTLTGAAGQTADILRAPGGARIPAAGNYFIAPGITSTFVADFNAGSTTTTPVTIAGLSGQTANLLRLAVAGTDVATFTALGGLNNPTAGNISLFQRLGGAPFLGTLSVSTNSASQIGAVIRGAASQSADHLQVQNSAGGNLWRVNNNGVPISSNVWTSFVQGVAGGGGAYIRLTGNETIMTGDVATTVKSIVRGSTGQVEDLSEWQSWDGTNATVLGGRNANGQIFTGSISPIQTAVGAGINGVSASGTVVTISTTNAHGLANGDRVTIAGLTPAGYNGTYIISGVSTFSFNIANTTTGTATGSGTVSVDAQTSITARSAGTIALQVRGATSQAADLLRFVNAGGTTLSWFNAGGSLFMGGSGTLISAVSGRAAFITNDATQVPMLVRGAASQSANLQEWQSSAGSILARVNASGIILGASLRTINQTAQIKEENAGAALSLTKMTSQAGNDGAGIGRLYFRDGTNAGTLKLCVRAGAAGAETTILDNIPQ